VPRTAISRGARRITILLATAMLAPAALAPSAAAATHVDGISQGVLDSPGPDGKTPPNEFTNNESTRYVRVGTTDSSWGYWDGSQCVSEGGDSAFVAHMQAAEKFATPVVVLSISQPWQPAESEACVVEFMMQALKTASALPYPLIFEPANEPELTGLPPEVAAALVGWAKWGAYLATSGDLNSLYVLAGSFVHPNPNNGGEYYSGCAPAYNTTSYETCYYDNLQADGYLQYVSGWSVHDYDDPTDSQNLNWCYDTNGSFSGCDDPGLSAWRGWEGGIADNDTWVTETGDPDLWLKDNCNESHPHGCTATGKNDWTNARSATAVEYFSQWTAHTFWYDWDAGSNGGASEWCYTPGWDSSLLNTYASQTVNSQDSPRAAYYVVGLHKNTSDAITLAGTGGDYEEAYFTGEACPN
jgi:hypothetical protein